MKTIKYNIIVPDKFKLDKKRVTEKINKVLCDKRGWLGHGYKFKYSENSPKFTITFRTSADIRKTCGFSGLSCADLEKGVVYFNIRRWKLGNTKSKLSLHQYRIYMINHEVGHMLGRGHVKFAQFSGGPCPVMVQQTLGIGKLEPNPWPLDWE